MKAVMYHYVRKGSADLPNFFHLDCDDFESQLDFFEKEYGFINRVDFESRNSGEGVLLTFDDGLKEHHDVVLPILKKRCLWACFFIATAPYESGKLLNVHRIHMLLGKYNAAEMLTALKRKIDDLDIRYTSIKKFEKGTYKTQVSGGEATEFKRILNYYLDESQREQILHQMMEEYFDDETALAKEFYLSGSEIKSMRDAGMIMGSHTHSHPVMSKLNQSAQKQELARSFEILEGFGLSPDERYYCHPYGHKETYNEQTLKALKDLNVRDAFAVDPKDITAQDFAKNTLCLPRYDCNMFACGKASKGLERAVQENDTVSGKRRAL